MWSTTSRSVFRRFVGAVAVGVALAATSGCTVPVDAVAGISVTADGHLLGVMMVCGHQIHGATLYADSDDVNKQVTVGEPAEGRNRSPLDIPGAVLATLGLVSLVYGFARAESSGWSDATTIGLFVASVVLLVAFAVTEAKVKAPLPLRVVTDRNRGGVFLSLGLAVIGLFGLFLFLTFYLQIVRGYSPVKTGFAFLPSIVGIAVGSTQIGARLMPRLAPRGC